MAEAAAPGDKAGAEDGAEAGGGEHQAVDVFPLVKLVLDEPGDKGQEGEKEEAGSADDPDEDVHLGMAADIAEAGGEGVEDGGVVLADLFWVADAEEGGEDGEEADAVEEEVAGDADGGHGVSAEGGAEDAGEIELRGVEGNRVREVFAGNKAGDKGLVAGCVHGLGDAVEEAEDGDFPDVDQRSAVRVPEPGEEGQGECLDHHGGLGGQQEAALVDAVGDDSAIEREKEEGEGAGEGDDAEPEGGVGEGEDEPAEGDVLHPGADVGSEVAGPEEAEVGVAEGADDGREGPGGLVGRNEEAGRLGLASVIQRLKRLCGAGRGLGEVVRLRHLLSVI